MTKPGTIDPRVNPNLAVDLSKLKRAEPIQLTKDASKERAKRAKLEQAASFARRMNATFKGIAGSPSRRQHVQYAIYKYGLLDD